MPASEWMASIADICKVGWYLRSLYWTEWPSWMPGRVISWSPGFISAFPTVFCQNVGLHLNLGWVHLRQAGSGLLELLCWRMRRLSLSDWGLCRNTTNTVIFVIKLFISAWGPVLTFLSCVPSILCINSDRPLRCIRISPPVRIFMLDENQAE